MDINLFVGSIIIIVYSMCLYGFGYRDGKIKGDFPDYMKGYKDGYKDSWSRISCNVPTDIRTNVSDPPQ